MQKKSLFLELTLLLASLRSMAVLSDAAPSDSTFTDSLPPAYEPLALALM